MKINKDLVISDTNKTLEDVAELTNRNTTDVVRAYCYSESIPKDTYKAIEWYAGANASTDGIYKSSSTQWTIKDSNIKKVNIAYDFLFGDWSTRTIYINVMKNGSSYHRTYTRDQAGVNGMTIMSVTEGDVISLQLYSSVAGTLNGLAEYNYIMISAA